MKSKTITLDKKYEIQELPLGSYRELFKKVKLLYGKVSEDFKDLEQTSIIEALPQILDEAWDETIDLIEFATKVPKETLEKKIGMGGLITLVDAVWEVNDIDLLKKKLQPLFQTPSQNLSQNLPKNTAGVQDKSSKK